MKKINFRTILYILLGIAVVFALDYFFLRKPAEETAHDHKHQKNKEAVKEENTAVKEVELSKAQFENASIELGGFSLKNLSEVVNANGYTKLPPQNQADVSVHMGGIVTSIKVIEGEQVKKGQILAVLESPEFARLQEAYLTSKSNLEFLKLDFERQKILSKENVNSKKIFQRTKSDYEIEKAKFNSLDKQLSLLNLSKTSVNSLMYVTSPISGHVTEINITLSSSAEPGKPLLTIVDNSKLHVDLLVYEKDLSKVKPGQTVRFVLTNQDNTEIIGKVFNVSKSFENDTKSVAVHADIVNTGQSLIPGMYVNALIDVGTHRVEAIPSEAVVRAEGREYIFILEDEHKEPDHSEHAEQGHDDENIPEEDSYHFQRIEVKTGTTQLGYTQITPLQKIQKETIIVLKGAYYIQSHLVKSQGGGEHHH